MTYDPKKALKAFAEGRKSRLTNQKAETKAYDITPKPATFCMPLAAFVDESPHLPDDFHTVERSSEGLRTYTRPDGAVFIGLFELPNDPKSTIVVFGDPMMDLAEAKRASIEFRRRLMQIAQEAHEKQQREQKDAEFAGKPSLTS